MDEKRKIGIDTIVLLSSRLANFFFIFLVSLILTRGLGPENYGIWSFAISIAILSTTIGSLGLNVITTKYLPFYFGKGEFGKVKHIFLQSLTLVLAFAIILGIILYSISFSLPYSNVIILLLPYFIFSTIYSLTSATLFAIRRIKEFSIIDTSYVLIQLIILAIFNLQGLTINETIISFTISSIMATVASFFIVNKIVLSKYRTEESEEKISSIFRISLPWNISVISNNLSEKIPIFILTFLTFVYSIKEVGFFSFAISLTTIVAALITSLTDIGIPFIIQLSGTKKKRRIPTVTMTLTRYTYIATLPLIFILAFGSETIITFFFGSKYLPAAPMIMILSIILIPITFRKLITASILIKNKIQIYFYIELLRLAISIPLIFFLSYNFGGMGASIGFTISLFVTYSLFSVIDKTLTKKIMKTIMKIFVSSLVFAILYFIPRHMLAFIGSVLGLSVLYFAILFVAKEFTKEDWKKVLLIFRRSN
jgi:O-antigen/teichoic acid export membrane protein